MHFNKYQILTTDKYTKFEHLYKKVKHICVVIFWWFLIGFIILLSLVLYFQQLTKDASSISDRELKAKILHIPGDELINHNNQILEEYDHSQNTLIVGPNHVNSNIIHAQPLKIHYFINITVLCLKHFLRAMLQDITNSNQSSGGSTITQQLVKIKCSQIKTYSRKANEIILATRVENLLSKDEIIYTYLNIVPFGHDYNGANITGISSASYSLFGIPAKI